MTQSQITQSDIASSARWSLTETKPYVLLIEANASHLTLDAPPVAWLRSLVDQHLVVVLRGFRGFASSTDFERYATTWGPLLRWNFGTILEVKEDPATIDTVFDSSGIPLHWDAMFNQVCPKYVLFESVRSPLPGDGGRTTFCNTRRAIEAASEAQLVRWRRTKISYSVERLAHYGGTVTSNIVTVHPEFPDREVIRYGEPEDAGVVLKNPVQRRFEAPDYASSEAVIAEMREVLNDPRCFYAHPWQDGDLLLCDNYTILHGREPFKSHTFRHLRRAQVLATPPHRNTWQP